MANHWLAYLTAQQRMLGSEDFGRLQLDVNFPLHETSVLACSQAACDLRFPCLDMKQAATHKSWPESESESTTAGSPNSDSFDARTSEVSSLDLDSQPSQDESCLTHPLDQEVCVSFPVKRTFIHFDDPSSSLTRSSSAPAIMCQELFQRKRNPEMEAAHFNGECQPCAYFTHKEDGCRWGSECKFCHLCPAEAVKKKRKERLKAMKAENAAQSRLSKPWQPTAPSTPSFPSSNWRQRTFHVARPGGPKTILNGR